MNCTRTVDYFYPWGGIIHEAKYNYRSLHLVVGPVTRCHGRKPTVGEIDPVAGDG